MNLPQVSGFSFSGTDWGGANIVKDWDRDDAETAWIRSNASAEADRNWQQMMSSTSWQRGVEDMKRAGLNPMLAYQQGGASTPRGASFAAPLAHRTLPGAGGGVQMQTAAQVNLANAEADKARADAEATRSTYPVTIDTLKQSISESQARIAGIYSTIKFQTSSAAHNYQMIENLKAQLPQIKADTTKLLSQARKYASEANLANTQERETAQRLKANLPALEAAIKDLERSIITMSLPGHRADEAARDSLIGQIGAYLKALGGVGGVIGVMPLGRAQRAPAGQPPLIHKGTGTNPSIHRR